MRTIRVLIVDDQPLIRSGLHATFSKADDIVVVGEAANGVDAVRMVRSQQPDVVLMDIDMPRMNGLTATREIVALDRRKPTKVVILTIFDQDEHLFDALRSGASGFILKHAPIERLLEAVREAAEGDALLSPSVTRRLIDEFARRPELSSGSAQTLDKLTEREREVFRLLVRGYSNEEIARTLVLGDSTIKSHVQHLYQKLGVRDRVQVVIYAYENGLVPVSP
ncbi:response regulator transcription factor [Nonomuraea roseola]|jgi:DNA-binding NarL/FixJ family response regulator|uniref:Response regulator n=1 Tax=Nonomuraea roseola TaxID=46179 RepID=A0ABV5PP77_9ACTN